MRKIKKSIIILLCIGFLLFFFLHTIYINTDAVFCRYLFPHDMFLILEGEEEIEVSLNIVLDGKRRLIHSFTAPEEKDVYYFFLPAGSGNAAVRVIRNLDFKKWKTPIEDFMRVEISDEQRNIRIKVQNISEKEDKELCIRFMESEKQPSVFIEAEEDLDQLTADRELKVKGNICIYDAKASTLFSGKMKFKGHGNGSWEHNVKKSWSLEFDEPTSILNLDKGYKYIALSNAHDQSYLRNKFVYDWAKEMGMAYSPRSEFGNLYFNGEYLGLYLFAEGIEVSEDRIAVQQDKNDSGKSKINTLEYYEKEDEKGYIIQKGMEEDEDVGYLLREENLESRYRKMECAFKTESGSMIEIIYPQKASQKQISNIRNYIQEFQDAVESEDGYCDTLKGKKHYSEFIDIDSFIKKYLIEQISKNHDGNIFSSYFYMKKYADDQILYEGPVWDYDVAFGGGGFNAMWKGPKGVVKLNPGLDEHDEFMGAVIQYYADFFKPYLEKEAESKIRGYADEIGASALMDRSRWEYENNYEPGTFDEQVDQLVTFIKERKQFLDDVWLNGKIYYRVNFVDEDTIVETMYVEKGESLNDVMDDTYKLTEEGKKFVGWYDESLEDEINFDEEITENMAFWAKWE